MKIAIFGENILSRELSEKIQINNQDVFRIALNSIASVKENLSEISLFIFTEWSDEIKVLSKSLNFEDNPIFLGFIDNIPHSQNFLDCFSELYLDGLSSVLEPGKFIFAEPKEKIVREKLSSIKTFLSEKGIEIILSEQILIERWLKLQWNCSLEALSFLEKLSKSEILSDSLRRSRVIRLMIEVSRVGKIEGIRFPDNLINRLLKIPFENPELRTNEKFDFENNNGYLIATSQKKNLKIPENQRIYSELKNTFFQK